MARGKTAPQLTLADLLRVKAKIVFMPLQGLHGEISADNHIILDPRGRTILHTLLHELIHALRPLYSESWIRRETTRLWALASWRDKAALAKLLGKATIWDGEGRIEDPPEELKDGTEIQNGSKHQGPTAADAGGPQARGTDLR